MLRAPIINSSLRGYLDFLGIRFNGRNPQQAGEVLQPTFDLELWYLESQVLEVSPATVTLNADAGQNNVDMNVVGLSTAGQLVVPTTEMWILMPGTAVSIGFTAVAGQSGRVGVGVIVNTAVVGVGTSVNFEGESQSDAAIARGGRSTIYRPQFIGPGQRIVWRHFGILAAANNVTLNASLRLVRLGI